MSAVNPIAEIENLVKNFRILEVSKNAAENVSCCRFEYASDGNAISGFAAFPKNISEKIPVIIYNRGGSFDFGLVDDQFLFTFLSRLASWGYFVIGTQYPGNSCSEGIEEFGGESDVRSVLKLKEIIDQLSFVNKERIGMFGHSRGGMMTYLCLKRVGWIKTALTVGGLTNLESTVAFRPEMDHVYKKAFNSTAAGKASRSVVNWVDELDKSSSLCMLHGGADTRVLPKGSIDLAQKLDEIGYNYSLHVLQGGSHYLMNRRDIAEAIMKDWFANNL